MTKLGDSAHLRSSYFVLEEILSLRMPFLNCKMKGLDYNRECQIVVCGLDQIHRILCLKCVVFLKSMNSLLT